jgi:hypothetical protein
MRGEMALLAEALHEENAAAAGLVAALDSDLSVTEIIAGAPIALTRIKLTERAQAFDLARKGARHAIVTLLIAEDFTIAEIAHVFGVSRQLASRLAQEARASKGLTDDLA